jgi:hypothetical protein
MYIGTNTSFVFGGSFSTIARKKSGANVVISFMVVFGVEKAPLFSYLQFWYLVFTCVLNGFGPVLYPQSLETMDIYARNMLQLYLMHPFFIAYTLGVTQNHQNPETRHLHYRKKEESSTSDWWSGAYLKGLTFPPRGTCDNAGLSVVHERRRITALSLLSVRTSDDWKAMIVWLVWKCGHQLSIKFQSFQNSKLQLLYFISFSKMEVTIWHALSSSHVCK